MRNKRHFRRPLFAIIAAVFLLAIGGTIALVSEQMNFNNKFSLSAENIDHIETFDSPQDWQPCQEEPKTVVTTNNSTHPVKVRLSYDEWWRNQADTENLPIEQDGRRLTTINFQNENDWELIGDWYYWKGELAPGASTRSLFKSVTLDCSANFAVQHVCNGTTCEDVHSPYEGAKYHINIIVQTTEGDFPHDDEYFNVSIDPNGGEFNGSSAVYTDSIQYGTTIDLDNISYTDHELVDWTLNGSTSYTDSRIRITNHTTLVANWRSSIFHNITVDPNGGSLDGRTEPSITSVRQGEDFTLTDSIPTRDDYIFNRWDIKVGDAEAVPLTDHTFTVTDDAVITATWDKIIAKNVQTNVVYPSINSAITAANSGETILLVTDTEEAVTVASDRNLTLDLGEHIVTGSLVNDGTLTLLNGEINNPDGTAAINNGTLTLGINDYKEDRTADIDDDYVRLIGSTVGLDQNGIFNYYDGRIQGDVALDGGYDAAPSYRIAWDSEIVYFFPLVDHDWVADNQFTTLASADNAVSKTKVGGDIYYYDLQDNIDASSRTGYKIYIVRDFTAPYAITSEAGTDVTIDLAGFDVIASDTITINGKLTIEDSETTVGTVAREEGSSPIPSINDKVFVTPHDTTVTTVTYGGSISTPQTIINNGEFVVNNAYITGTSVNDSIKNYATLTMENGVIGATSGYVLQPIEGAEYELDENSYFYSSSTSKAAIYDTINNLSWNSGGIIYGKHRGIELSAGSYQNERTVSIDNVFVFGVNAGLYMSSYNTVTVSPGGIIGSESYGVFQADTSDAFTLNGGTIEAYRTTSGDIYGINGKDSSYGSRSHVYIKPGSTINVTNIASGVYDVRGIYDGNGTIDGLTMNIKAVSLYRNVDALYSAEFTIENSEINVTNTGVATSRYYSSRATGANMEVSSVKNTTINVFSNGQAQGIYEDISTINGVTITATSKNDVAYGVYSNSNLTITNSTITATSETGTSYGLHQHYNKTATILSGKIEGGTYGIYTNPSTDYPYRGYATIGVNEGETPDINSPEIIGGDYALYGHSFNFYDGVLRGGIQSYQPGVITGIPDGTTYHTEETSEYKENTYLVNAANYLRVGNTEYNSLQKAYDAVSEDSNVIEVIASVSIEAILPHSPADKNIIFDLNGYELTYSQSLINDGTMTIRDSSPEKTGKLLHPNNISVTIINNGDLTLESGYISAGSQGVRNEKDSSFTMNGGTIYSSNYGIYSTGEYQHTSTATLNGGTITSTGTGIYSTYSTITINSATIEGNQTAINQKYSSVITANTGSLIKSSRCGVFQDETSNTFTLNGGAIEVTRSGTSESLYGIQGKNGSYGSRSSIYVKPGSTINVTNTASEFYDVYGIYGGAGSVEGATINVSGVSIYRGIYGTYYASLSIKDSIINSTNTGIATSKYYSSTAYGVDDATSISNSTITARSNGKAYGVNEETTSISDSTITAISSDDVAYGVYSNSNLTITNSTITATSETGTSYGLHQHYNKTATILSGKIEGGTYGIYTNPSTDYPYRGYATIGVNEGETPDINSPEIIGGDYALYGHSFNFYDGVLRGGIQSYQEGTVKQIADNASLHVETQTIDGKDYDVRYLVPLYDVAKIGNTRYTRLGDAIDDAISGDVIELLVDNYIFDAINISDGKDFTIETHDFIIDSNNPITNSGKVRIINSEPSSLSRPFRYFGSDYLFINNDGASLTLVDLKMTGSRLIHNFGTLFTDNLRIDSSDVAINNESVNNAGVNTNLVIVSSNYGFYNNGGELIADTFSLTGKAYSNDGKLNLKNGIINPTELMKTNLVTTAQAGDIFLDNTQVNMGTEYYVQSSYDAQRTYAYIVVNAGTFAAEHSAVNYDLQGKTNVNTYALYNTGTASFIDSHISFNPANLTEGYSPYSAYGIYNTSGTIGFESGSIYVPNKTAYGIYSETGTITLGVPEQPGPTYGKEDADVSTTNPDIKAIGTTTGIGVKNANGGKVYYYDGRITGSSSAMPENPTATEYMFDPKDYTDENNYHYRILEWRREQPGN